MKVSTTIIWTVGTKAFIELKFLQDANKSKDAELTQFNYVNIM